MTRNSPSTFIHFPTPPAPAPQGAGGRGAVSAGLGAAPSDPHSPGAAPAAEAGKRGRPSTYAPRILDMLCDSIRRQGLSDSAAAEEHGLSTSTLSRWKQLFPEVGIKLKQARAEIRGFHFQRITDHAGRDDAKGLRASMWILERLYPGDYSPRIKDRLLWLNLQDRLRTREENEMREAELQAMREQEAEQRAAAAAAREAAEAAAQEEAGAASAGVSPADGEDPRRDAEPTPIGEGENRAFTLDGDSHNSRNSAAEVRPVGAAAAASGGTPPADGEEIERGAETAAVAEPENRVITWESDSRNSRKSVVEEAAVEGAATPHPQQAAATAKRQQAAAVQGSGTERTEFASYGVSFDSQNLPPLADPRVPAPARVCRDTEGRTTDFTDGDGSGSVCAGLNIFLVDKAT